MIDYMRSKDARYALARTHPKDWGWVLPPCGVGPQDWRLTLAHLRPQDSPLRHRKHGVRTQAVQPLW